MDSRFHQLMQQKKRLIIPILVFLFVFYFALPFVLAIFPEFINRTFFLTGLTWAWLYAFVQIPLTWLLGWIYYRRAKQWDALVEQMKQEVEK